MEPQEPTKDPEIIESNNADIQFQESIPSATEIDNHQSQEPRTNQLSCFACNSSMVWESKRNCPGCCLTPLFPPEKLQELMDIKAVYNVTKLRQICNTYPSRNKQEEIISKLLVKARQKLAAQKKIEEDKKKKEAEENQKHDREILNYQFIISHLIGGNNSGTAGTSMGGSYMPNNMHTGTSMGGSNMPNTMHTGTSMGGMPNTMHTGTSMGGSNMPNNMHMGQGNYSYSTTGIRISGNHPMAQHNARNYGLPSNNTGIPGTSFGVGMNIRQHGNYSNDNTGIPGTSFGVGINMGQHGNYSSDNAWNPGTSFGPTNVGINMGQHGNYSSDNTWNPGTSFGPTNVGINMGQHGNYSSNNTWMHRTSFGPTNVGNNMGQHGNYFQNTHPTAHHTARNYEILPTDNTGMPGSSFRPNNIGMRQHGNFCHHMNGIRMSGYHPMAGDNTWMMPGTSFGLNNIGVNMGQHGNYSSDNTGMHGTSFGPHIGMNMGQNGYYSHDTTIGVGPALEMVGNYATTQHQPTAGDLLIGADDLDLLIGADHNIGPNYNPGGGGVAVDVSNYTVGTEILTAGNNCTAPHQSTASDLLVGADYTIGSNNNLGGGGVAVAGSNYTVGTEILTAGNNCSAPHQSSAGDLLIGPDNTIGSNNNPGGGDVAVAGSNYTVGTEILTAGNNCTAPHQSTSIGNYGAGARGQPIQQGENSSRGMPTGPGGLPVSLAGSQYQLNTDDGEGFQDFLV